MNDDLLKSIHSSLCIRFGTSAPFLIDGIRAERVGYARIPGAIADVICREEDIPALVPIVRQRIYGELAERGWTPDDIQFQPTVQRGRRRKFVDGNESSESFGANKFGVEHRFLFEMERELAQATFPVGAGSFARLPSRQQR